MNVSFQSPSVFLPVFNFLSKLFPYITRQESICSFHPDIHIRIHGYPSHLIFCTKDISCQFTPSIFPFADSFAIVIKTFYINKKKELVVPILSTSLSRLILRVRLESVLSLVLVIICSLLHAGGRPHQLHAGHGALQHALLQPRLAPHRPRLLHRQRPLEEDRTHQ